MGHNLAGMRMKNQGLVCSVESCTVSALSRGLCNAHYLRFRQGRSMAGAVELRIKDRLCSKNKCIKRHYGNNLCRRHWNIWKRIQLKTELIAVLGGQCSSCQGIFHSSVYDFHHRDPSKKDFSFGDFAVDNPDKTRKEVLGKCNLLCANCHRITHFLDHEDANV